MKAAKKTISINIDFFDKNDFIKALDYIKANAHSVNKKPYERLAINTAFIEYGLTIDYNIKPRIETINGKECIIFESKLNFE